MELEICKLQKVLVFNEDQDVKEQILLERLNDLKNENQQWANEISEINVNEYVKF